MTLNRTVLLTAAILSSAACEQPPATTGPEEPSSRSLLPASTDWVEGDVFAGIGGGSYDVYSNGGILKETISDGLGGFTTGCALDNAQNKLHTTNFSVDRVVVYQVPQPHAIDQVIDVTPGEAPESIVFDASGNFYVGHADGDRDIRKYDATGTLLMSFNVATEVRGSDWIDLSADQTTMFYTSEGRRIFRYDVGTSAQLADFALLPGAGVAYALRLLPPGDGSGGLLVADNGNIKRLDGTGAVIATYDVTGADGWFSLNLDPDGTSFWAGDFGNDTFYKFDIATGAGLDNQLLAVPTGGELFGICVMGELTAGGGDNEPVTVEIDIKPGSDPNSINLRNRGVIPVAILGSETFDVTEIDVTTLAFGPAGAAPVRGGHLEDVNGDGFMDLVTHYQTADTGIAAGDTEACVTGLTTDGDEFSGCDSVRIVGS